ncbi:CLUMA_CG011954, isoform A [Clunio marinus]|uniref:Phosphatidylinositol-glycan biosynthesis class W protein n=1 Tax=Clunio marinus TaxID=568069 RepID=A0A1J1IKH0_9DIPT|nr:CLUMA_CG011954, isoform A [Clunio marinus]
MLPDQYKTFHESFMINNNGTTAFDTFLFIVPSSFAIFYTITIAGILKISLNNVPIRFLVEFFTTCVSLILYLTVFSDAISQIVLTLLIITIPMAVRQLQAKFHLTPFVQIPSVHPDFITVGRSVISLITAVCILAVDFQCFPRKLAKTEKFGFGLMDVGVGLFVFSNGIIVKPSASAFSKKKFQKLLVGCFPLFILGFSRFLVTKEINYQEHVTEYGVHWNFFITLAVTKIIGTVIEGFLKTTDQIKYAALSVVILHETFLQLGLSNYILDDNITRDHLISANREGIFSIPGYVALYLASIYIGTLLKSDGRESMKARDVIQKAGKLFIISLFCWKMIYVCNGMFGVSRRTANMGYNFWVLAIGCLMFSLFMFTEIYIYYTNFNRPQWQQVEPNNKSQLDVPDFHVPYVPLILQAINYNGLAFFLIANLFTGIVNICFQTMLLNTPLSVIIITIYTLLLQLVMVFLFINKIKLKIW